MSRKSPIRRAVPSALAIVVTVLSLVAGSGLGVLGARATQASGSHGSSGARSPGWYGYDDGLRMLAGYDTPRADLGADLQVLRRRAPHQPIDHSYDDVQNVARTPARLSGYGLAPRTVADDLVGAVCSFGAATTVVMADRTRKAISEIKVGDYVLAEDPETGERGPRRVRRVWEQEDTVVDFEIDGDLVTTTEDHPFWNATDGEWQEAQELDAGDLLPTADGDPVELDGLRLRTARTTTAFNLTVDGIHTYFVGVGEDEVLVHNTCGVPANLGQTYGGRTVVENPNIRITGLRGSANPADPFHGLNRAIERGVRPADILETMRNPVAVLQEGQRYTYLSDVAAVVVRADGQVVTVWGGAQHNASIWQIIADARGGL